MNDHRIPIFTLRNGTKVFNDVTVVAGVDIDVLPTEILGIAGENGAGKSTILKMIAGIHAPSAGSMELAGRPYRPTRYTQAVEAGVSMVFQEQALIPSLAVYENVFLSLEKDFTKFGVVNKAAMISYCQRKIEQLGITHIDPRRRTVDYPFHDRQMIEIAKAFTLAEYFRIDHPLILLDEPTAAIGEREIAILFESIRRFRQRASFVLITHRLSEYAELCDRIIVMKDGRRTGEFLRDQISDHNIYQAMVGRVRGDTYFKEQRQLDVTTAPVAASVAGLGGGAVHDVSFQIRSGEILGIGGLVGCGKEAVARAMVGFDPFPTGGIVEMNGNRLPAQGRGNAAIRQRVGFVPKERKTEGIVPYMSVEANISLASLPLVSGLRGFISRSRERALANKHIEGLRIKCAGPQQLAQYLSGGNQQKVVLAKWLAREVQILVLDNPTRGVDVGAKEEIYTVLRELAERGVAILLVTDDLLELIGMSNRILVMRDGRVSFEREAGATDKPTEHELVRYMV